MHYQSALVLSTLAIGQAAAANHRHASFHARRNANSVGPEGVEWNKVVRDAVDYDAAIKSANIPQSEWDAIFASQNGQKAPATTKAAPATTQAAPVITAAEAKPTSVVESPPKSSAKSSAKSSQKASSTESAPPAETSKTSSGGGDVLEAIGCAKGQNSNEPNGKIWIGDSGSKTQFTFTNDADEDSAVLCWDFATMFSSKKNSLIAVPVGAGSSITLSVAGGFSGGCGPAYADSVFQDPSGILWESILEFTTAPDTPVQYVTGVYDISKEVNMDGVVMSATGNHQCTSGVKDGAVSCLFGCVGGASTCEKTGTYGITAGSDESGMCNVGVDTTGNGGASGGCQFNADGDHLKITYSNSRSWPQATY